MASSKDTFETDTFEAKVFACGAFRGTGVTVIGSVVPPTLFSDIYAPIMIGTGIKSIGNPTGKTGSGTMTGKAGG